MQIDVDVTYTHTNFGGCDLSGFGDIATFKNDVDEICMCTNFGGRDLSGFGDIATFKNGKISLSTHGL